MKKEHKELLCDIIDGVIKADESKSETLRGLYRRTDPQLYQAVLDRIYSKISQMNTGLSGLSDLTLLRSDLLQSREWTFMSPDDVAEKITLVDKKIQRREEKEKERKETVRFLQNIAGELSMIIQLENL